MSTETYYDVYRRGKYDNGGFTAKEVERYLLNTVTDSESDLSEVVERPVGTVVGTWVIAVGETVVIEGNRYGDPMDCCPDDYKERWDPDWYVEFEVVESDCDE